MAKHNIFISWSGNRSLHAAEALREWLPKVIQAAKPWLSDRDVEKGTRGLTEIGKALEGMKVGIICLTPENLDAPWILYECGALSKTFSDNKTRLCTYLLGGLQSGNVTGPLSMFQYTKSEKEDMRKLVHSINTAISAEPLPRDRLDDIFNTMWPQFDAKLSAMPAPEKMVNVTREPKEMINEILGLCRQYLPTIGTLGRDGLAIQNPNPPQPSPAPVVGWQPWVQTIWVKRKGIEKLEYVDGRTYHETPAPGVLIIYRGPSVLARFDDVEDFGQWNDGTEVRAKYKVEF
jgi:hypothetical protein